MIDFEEFKAASNFQQLSPVEKKFFIEKIEKEGTEEEKAALAYDWINIWSRPEQIPYAYTTWDEWDEWAFIAGRGAGKTKAGAEFCREVFFNVFKGYSISIGCVTPRFSDIEGIVAWGESGVMNCLAPWELQHAKYYSTRRKIVFFEGTSYESQIQFFSADDPEALRGNQWHIAWLDEMAGYPKPEEILMQVDFCLRLKLPGGIGSKLITTTTPKPYQFLRDKIKEAQTNKRILITRGSTYDNTAHLSERIFRAIIKYEGTRIGEQEIYGEIISGDSAGIIKKSWLKMWSAQDPLPKLVYVFLSYDTAFTEKKENDPTGTFIFGVFKDKDGEFSVLVLDAYEEYLAYADLKAQVIVDYEEKYGEAENKKYPAAAIVENKGTGSLIVEELTRTGVKFIKFNPGNNDKQARLHSVSWFFKEGRVYLPESRKHPGEFLSYMIPFIEQLTNFPLVKHDDMVDACTQALILLTRGGLFTGDYTDREDEDNYDESESVYVPPVENPYMQ